MINILRSIQHVNLYHVFPSSVLTNGKICGIVAREINFILFTPQLALLSVAKIFPATIPSCSTDCVLIILVSLTHTYWVWAFYLVAGLRELITAMRVILFSPVMTSSLNCHKNIIIMNYFYRIVQLICCDTHTQICSLSFLDQMCKKTFQHCPVITSQFLKIKLLSNYDARTSNFE